MKASDKVRCQVSGKEIADGQAVKVNTLRKPLLELLKKSYPEIDEKGCISEKTYNHLLSEYVEDIIEKDKGELSKLDSEVVKSIEESVVLAKNTNETIEEEITFGQRMSDKIAAFGGSWTFILAFVSFILVWACVNAFILKSKPFDPYPFILLNLMLSALAAVQAPIIMMSQNRVEAKDRIRAEHDYQINLKAELEIRSLHEKMDHLLTKQMQHLSEIQQIQIDLLEKIKDARK
jgi:uncharacterized membrane protein